MQGRNKKGQFGSKSDSSRKVKSLRVTDDIWKEAGIEADKRGNTRHNDGIKLLEEAVLLKANAGGAIKKKIREYLKLFH